MKAQNCSDGNCRLRIGPAVGQHTNGGCRCLRDLPVPLRIAIQRKLDWQQNEIERLRGYFAATLPYLEEAWEACFHGQKQKLLSAEERGMGVLLNQFREIAEGKQTVPVGLVSEDECSKRVNAAAEWSHQILGSPNELREPLRRFVRVGETCADGLDRANSEIERLRAFIRHRVHDKSLWKHGGYHGRRIYLEAQAILAEETKREESA